jgi:tetratricopeptide (TPR) repeat protein
VALAASVIATMVVAGGAWAWMRQRQEREARRVDMALSEARIRREAAESAPDDPTCWPAALDAALAVERLAADARDEATRRRVTQLVGAVRTAAAAAVADRTLLGYLVDIRSAKADDPNGSVGDAAYAAAFREAGYDVDQSSPALAAARIRSRPAGVALALAAALDDWAGQRRKSRPRDAEAWKRLVETARAADPDPTRDRLRVLWSQPESPARREQLGALTRDVDPHVWPPASLSLLAEALSEAGARDAAVDLLRRAQTQHPGDVWVNYKLGSALEQLHPSRSEAAIGFFTVARALRPETAHDLAHALESRGRDDEAQVVFDDLTRLRPANGHHWACLGQLLLRKGDPAGSQAALEQAVAALRAAIQVKPEDVFAHVHLGYSLEALGELAEADTEYRAAIRVKPDSAHAHSCLGGMLYDQGKLDEAIAECREAIRLDPNFIPAHHNLGRALRDQGKVADAIIEFREAIRLDGDLVGESSFELGPTLCRIGRYSEAIELYRRLRERARDNPRLEERVAGALADVERQAALAARLPAVLRGNDKPKDAAEGLEFASLAFYARRFGSSARLYAESFRADPRLAEDMAAQHRYVAACSAALAVAGKARLEPPMDEPAKTRWRQQALEWLRADLAYGTNLVQVGPPVAKEIVRLRLKHWKVDPSLVSVRDKDALYGLPANENRSWRDFWGEVEALIGTP